MKPSEISQDAGDATPPAGKHVLVHCRGFSCLGYRDQAGRWKNVFTHEDLPEVIDFAPIN